MKKTNAMRILDGLNIKYEVQEYEADVDHELPKGATTEQLKNWELKKVRFLRLLFLGLIQKKSALSVRVQNLKSI